MTYQKAPTKTQMVTSYAQQAKHVNDKNSKVHQHVRIPVLKPLVGPPKPLPGQFDPGQLGMNSL